MSSETPPSDAIHALHAAYQSANADMLALLPTLPTLPDAINALGLLVYTSAGSGIDKDELAALVTEIKRHTEILSRVATTYHAIMTQIVTGIECPVPEVSEEQLL